MILAQPLASGPDPVMSAKFVHVNVSKLLRTNKMVHEH